MTPSEKVFQEIVDEAEIAARTAFLAATPRPMVVQGHAHPLDDSSPVTEQWYVPEGVCGFANVVLKPATTKFAKWLKKEYNFEPAYRGGLHVSIYPFIPSSQSYERNRQAAIAFARVLTLHGFNAIAESRVD